MSPEDPAGDEQLGNAHFALPARYCLPNTLRTLQIRLALGPFVVSFFRDVRPWIWFGLPKPSIYAFQEKRARSLVASIAGLGPTFAILAPIFASRADLINEPYLSELGKLTDAMPELLKQSITK